MVIFEFQTTPSPPAKKVTLLKGLPALANQRASIQGQTVRLPLENRPGQYSH